MEGFAGKVAAVTGAGSGIGQALALELGRSGASAEEVGARVLLISGCQDDQLSLDGFANGRFTEELIKVWNDGAWSGAYQSFHEAIRSGMPETQQPNYYPVGTPNPDFEQQDPLTIG